MYLLLVAYCITIAIASAVGGALPSVIRMTHARIQLVLSLVCGVMLGVALLHLLPHSIQILGDEKLATLLTLCGLLLMLFMIRIFNFHHHDTGGESEHVGNCDHDHDHDHEHAHDQHRVHNHDHPARSSELGWAGLCFGLAVHTLLDGIALAAAWESEKGGHLLAGFGTFLAVALHKPLDAISITSLMAAQRWSTGRQMAVNVIFALMCPLGALLFVATVGQWSEWRNYAIGVSLALSAGFFLCISLGDLLPEVHFHSHDRAWLSLMLAAGIAIAVVLEYVIGHGPLGVP
jgi:zinc and cadmium transporter